MLELNIENRKTQITNQNNQQNILALTKLMAQQTSPETLSTLYTNRAVLYFQLGNNQWALSDLDKALQVSHLNFVAYFNLFSLYVCQNNAMEGLKNLCCALSCLYLMRSRVSGNQSDINKCVKLAENNHEGRLMKALQYKKKEKYSLALNQIKWILQAEHYNPMIIQIRNYLQQIIKKQNKGKTVSRYDQANNSSQQQQSSLNKQRCRRLLCTLYDDLSQNQSLNLEQQIQMRLKQFNQIYDNLFRNNTTRHPGTHYNIFLIDKCQQNSLIQPNLKGSVKYTQQQNLLDLGSSIIQNRSRPNIFTPEYQYEQVQNSYRIIQSPPRLINRQISQQNDSVIHMVGAPRTSIFDQAGSTDSYCLQSNSSVGNQFGQIAFENSKKTSNKQKDRSKQMTISNSYDNSFVTVKALDDDKQLNIKVQKIELYNLPDEELQKMTNIYCTFQYGENKILLAKSAPLSKQGAQQKISLEPKRLRVKVLNKEILAFKDTYIGEGQQDIVRPGKYHILIYFTKHSPEELGIVVLDIKSQVQV